MIKHYGIVEKVECTVVKAFLKFGSGFYSFNFILANFYFTKNISIKCKQEEFNDN